MQKSSEILWAPGAVTGALAAMGLALLVLAFEASGRFRWPVHLDLTVYVFMLGVLVSRPLGLKKS